MKNGLKLVIAVLVVFSLMASMLTACSSEEKQTANNEPVMAANVGVTGHTTNFKTPVDPNEVYAYVSLLINYPMLVEHDQRAWKMACDELGVKSSITGPSEADTPGVITAIETAIAQKPAGLAVLGHDKALKAVIDKAVDTGIPTVCVDTDVPESKRLAFIGTDWSQIGKKQGEAMVKLIGEKGKVAAIGQIANPSMIKAYDAFKAVLAQYPNITFIGNFDSKNNEAETAKAIADVIRGNPDLAGIGCFDGAAGPGTAVAVKEANMVGKIKVTTVDIEAGQLNAVKEGVIQYAVGQKREVFTYYGVLSLFILNHSGMDFQKIDDERMNGLLPIPSNIDTGLIEVNDQNKEMFIKKMEENMKKK